MKKAFTIIELLVASLLLGMLVTVLTMIFNQSSIAWRTGAASVADLDKVRQKDAEIRDDADNAYVWNGQVHRLLGLWDDDESGKLRKRAWDVGDERRMASNHADINAITDDSTLNAFSLCTIGTMPSGEGKNTYTVNVKSAGPDRDLGTYDDIWSYPDDFD